MTKRDRTTEMKEPANRFVGARFIARKYAVSERHVLLLAAAKEIPSIRVGRKCIRFSEAAVAAALEGGTNP